MSTKDFVWRTFNEPKAEHKSIERVKHDSIDTDDPQYDWEYFGFEKYGRYAVCKNTNVKRGLTMGEFYGGGIVD